MKKEVNICLSPKAAASNEICKAELAKVIGVSPDDITKFTILRRSIDARGRNIKINLGAQVYVNEI
nr:FAD-binding protein [Prolixibacteraceae bacterium]